MQFFKDLMFFIIFQLMTQMEFFDNTQLISIQLQYPVRVKEAVTTF